MDRNRPGDIDTPLKPDIEVPESPVTLWMLTRVRFFYAGRATPVFLTRFFSTGIPDTTKRIVSCKRKQDSST
jgi:hypothetical protein